MALFAFMLIDHYVDSSPLQRTILTLHRIG
jgi:hypothetical protein